MSNWAPFNETFLLFSFSIWSYWRLKEAGTFHFHVDLKAQRSWDFSFSYWLEDKRICFMACSTIYSDLGWVISKKFKVNIFCQKVFRKQNIITSLRNVTGFFYDAWKKFKLLLKNVHHKTLRIWTKHGFLHKVWEVKIEWYLMSHLKLPWRPS